MTAAQTILVVDDNAPALKATVRILTQAGYAVAQAVDGVSALREIRARRPSLVLLDVVLPDIAGPEVLRQIRTDQALAGVSVVMMSAQQITPDQQAGGLDAGADGYIARPIATTELLARVRSQLRQRELTEQLRASEQRYRALFEYAPDGIVIADAQSIYLDANASICRMLGYAREELIGLHASDIVTPAEVAHIEPALREIQARSDYHREWQFRRKDGSAFIAEVIVTTMPDGNLLAMIRDITARKQAEAALETAHQKLIAASRQAGMAEVATGVLHNVGNVLNSANVSAALIADHVRHSKGANVAQLAALFDEHRADLASFVTQDPRGRMIPSYLATLAESLGQEQARVITELGHLRKNIEHIKDIVATQQSHAKNSQLRETVPLVDLIEEGLRMVAPALVRHELMVVRDYRIQPMVTTDRHKVMQILVNLIRNAKFACAEAGLTGPQITVRTTREDHAVQIAVSDQGVGIPAENLTRIFNHGFTTRQNGHGFGLHSGALAAKELGGALTAHSAGPGHGATFVLELPLPADFPSHEKSVP